jgi:N-acetyl sugar amidotransferase
MSDYIQCARCILDTKDDPAIIFDNQGICSYCRSYEIHEAKYVKKEKAGEKELMELVDKIKQEGEGKPYDCIIGISGGVDSTYLAMRAKALGLRPLAVHIDNGWNSELAVGNIENIIKRLGLELRTTVIDWEEFRDLQLSFLKASVVDIELVSDHAIFAQIYKYALKYNIKYILNGTNIATEFILPARWIHSKRDHVNILAIHKQFGARPLKTYPLFTSFLKWRCSWEGIQNISLLDYMPYNKQEVKKSIMRELGWRDYGGKHYESIFTRFFQGYILPVKFGIDKRKTHLSNLICSGQITREEALNEMKLPAYSEDVRAADHQFVLKKLELTERQFEDIMNLPVKAHTDYPVETDIYKRIPVLRLLRSGWYLLRKIRHSN